MPTGRPAQDQPDEQAQVYVGVDTHADKHFAAVVDPLRRELGHQAFPTTPAGYQSLLRWATTYGNVAAIGIEGTSSYGAALTRYLLSAGARWSRWTARTARAAGSRASPIRWTPMQRLEPRLQDVPVGHRRARTASSR